MKQKWFLGLLIGLLVCGVSAFAQDSRDVTFSVDMSVQINKGNFSHATNTVDLRGSINGWGTTAMARDGMTDIYTVTIPVTGAAGETNEYKFFSAGMPNDGWETVPNRTFLLGPADTPQTLDMVFFNDEEPVGDEVQAAVAFSVDMSVEIAEDRFDPEGGMDVLVRGGFNEWQGNASKLDREGNTSIYSGTFNITTQENAQVEYKFVYTTIGDDAWEAKIDNRSFRMGDGSPQTLPTVVFNNEIPVQPKDLEFTAGTWNPAALGDYEFELTRVVDPMDVGQIALSSDNETAVKVPMAVWFNGDEATVSFNAEVASLTNGDATITASNTTSGAWDTYTVRAPVLSINGPWEVYAAGPVTYTLTRFAGIGNAIVLASSDPAVLTVPATPVSFVDEETEVTFDINAVTKGQATITATAANGIQGEFVVTFTSPRLELSGPLSVMAGNNGTYTVTRHGPIGDIVNLASDDENVMTVPATVTFGYEEDTATFQAAAKVVGATVLRAGNDDATATPLSVVVAERPAYVMYDDASLYAGGEWTATPAHVTGFSDWTVTLSPELAGSERRVFIGSSPIADMDEDGKSFGLSAHWSGTEPETKPEIQVSRTFPALEVGQTFSTDIGYNWSGGAKGLKLKGTFEGNAYDRIELFNSGNDTWSYKLDGNDDTITVAWNGYIGGGFVGTVQVTCTAENTFDLSFQRAGEAAVVVSDVVLPGGIDTIAFYNWNGGSGDEENFYFNRMGILGAAAPSLEFIGGTWDPTALGEYEFTLRRTGSTGSEMIILQSDNTNSVTVPPAVWFNDDEATVSFNAEVKSLTNGDATIIASNALTGVWAEYTVRPAPPSENPPIEAITFVPGSGEIQFQVPSGYVLVGVEGADCQLVAGDLIWVELEEDVDYTYDAPEVTILTAAAARKMIRIRLALPMVGP